MKVFSTKGWHPLKDKESVHIASPTSLDECIHLAKIAVDCGRYNDKKSTLIWRQVLSACFNLEFDMRPMLETELSSGKTILESCIESKDWESCYVILRTLPDGTYCHGNVSRRQNALIMNENNNEQEVGILESPVLGCYYAGELLNGVPNGKGFRKLSPYRTFEGDIVDNQKTGWGVYRDGEDGKVTEEGLYFKDRYLGNPKNKPTQNFSALSIFSCLKKP